MNGVHDLGGMHGFGTVKPEPHEPVFHAGWERRVLALHLAMGATGAWSLDGFRFVRESLPPVQQLSRSYYETVLAAIEGLVTEHGIVAPEEMAAGRSLRPGKPVNRTLAAADVAQALQRGNPSAREAPHPARFRTGDTVRAKNLHPLTHTRLPRYVRGHIGTVTFVHGCHVFPDARARGDGENPQWLYTVRFDARELWGTDADPTLSVSVDAFEPYLEPAP